MTESKKTLESEGTTARPKEKPYVPIENRPLLGVDEVEALTGVPAKIIRAQVRNGLLKARMAGQHDHAHPPRRPGRLARRAARLARIRKPHLRPIVDEVGFFRTP